MNEKQLLQNLIKIPSYVDRKNNEAKLGNYIEKYIKTNIPWLKIYKQFIDEKRFNLIAYNNQYPEVIFSSHLDTVPPSGKIKERLTPIIKGGELFGLGSVDMKGGMSASIIAVKESNNKKAVALIFTCDEEYYFGGMLKFIREYKEGILPIKPEYKPKIVIFPEPTDLQIGYGCRGCVELEVKIQGLTGHAGKPKSGINAIEKGIQIVEILKRELNIKEEKELKFTSVNLASINGGVGVNDKIISRANAIPDRADFVLDIRVASYKQNALYIKNKLQNICDLLKVKLLECNIRLDLSPCLIDIKKLDIVEESIKRVGINPKYKTEIMYSGYGEFALVSSELGWTAIDYGPGVARTAHKIDERIKLDDLETVKKIYTNLINNFK